MASSALCILAGCATIAPKTPVGSDAPVRTSEIEVARDDGAYGTIQQYGTPSSSPRRGRATCSSVRRFSERPARTFENKSAATDWVLAGSGLALVGVGVATAVDAHGVASTDIDGLRRDIERYKGKGVI